MLTGAPYTSSPTRLSARRVRVADKALHIVAEPVVASCIAGGLVHTLLHYRPVSGSVEQKDVVVDLVAILQRVVIDLGGHAAGLHVWRRVEPQPGPGRCQ